MTAIALMAFVVSIGMSVFILLPKRDLSFCEAGTDLFAKLYPLRKDMSEVHLRIAFELDRLWDSNDKTIGRLTRAYIVASCALAVETLSLAALIGATLI